MPPNGRARAREIKSRWAQLLEDLIDHPAFAVNSPYKDTWLVNEHDARRRSYFGAQTPHLRCGRALPPNPPPLPVVKEEVEEEGEGNDLVLAQVLEESKRTVIEDEMRR